MTQTTLILPSARCNDGLRRYVPHATAALAVAALGVVSFFVVSDEGGRASSQRMVALALAAPLTRLAPVVGLDVEEARHRLNEGGIAVAHPGQSLKGIASVNHADPMRVLGLLLGPETPR